MKKILKMALLLAALSAGSAAPLFAGVSKTMTLKQRTDGADLVATARTVDVRSAWNAQKSEIYTWITLEINEVIKGEIKQKTVQLRQLGGSVGNAVSRVHGMPQFVQHEEVLVFLGTLGESGFYGVVDWLDGKKTISTLQNRQLVKADGANAKHVALNSYKQRIQNLLK